MSSNYNELLSEYKKKIDNACQKLHSKTKCDVCGGEACNICETIKFYLENEMNKVYQAGCENLMDGWDWQAWVLLGLNSGIDFIAATSGGEPEEILWFIGDSTTDPHTHREVLLLVRERFQKNQAKENSRKGGKKRTQEAQEKYNTHKHFWDEWQKKPSLYKTQTAFVDAMNDKTGTSRRVIYRHIKRFREN